LSEHANDRVRLAGAVVDRYHHASAYFQGRDEEYPVAGPFVAEGLGRGEKALHIADPPPRNAAEQRRVRIVGDMEWALEDWPGENRLLEYEAGVNDVLAVHKAPAVCCDDLARFGAATMVDIMGTHPMVIIGGELRESPFFVRPDEFLRELAARGGAGA